MMAHWVGLLLSELSDNAPSLGHSLHISTLFLLHSPEAQKAPGTPLVTSAPRLSSSPSHFNRTTKHSRNLNNGDAPGRGRREAVDAGQGTASLPAAAAGHPRHTPSLAAMA